MFEAPQGPEPLLGVRAERCPGAKRHWVERGVCLHHRSLQERVEANRSLGHFARGVESPVQHQQ